jgi:hypothetical protein
MSYLESVGPETHEEKIKELEKEQANFKVEKDKLDQELLNLEKELKDALVKEGDILAVIKKSAKSIEKIQANVGIRVNRILRKLSQVEKNKYNRSNLINFGLLKIQLDNLQEDLNNSLTQLATLVSLISNDPNAVIDLETPAIKELLSKEIDTRIISIKTVEEKNKLLLEYTNSKNELQKLISVLSNGKVAATSEFNKKIEEKIK